jgi:hypothetical protein
MHTVRSVCRVNRPPATQSDTPYGRSRPLCSHRVGCAPAPAPHCQRPQHCAEGTCGQCSATSRSCRAKPCPLWAGGMELRTCGLRPTWRRQQGPIPGAALLWDEWDHRPPPLVPAGDHWQEPVAARPRHLLRAGPTRRDAQLARVRMPRLATAEWRVREPLPSPRAAPGLVDATGGRAAAHGASPPSVKLCHAAVCAPQAMRPCGT